MRLPMSNPMREVRFFEWYVRYVWPFHRLFLRKHLSKRCSKCIISERHLELKGGLCPLCRNDASFEKSDRVPDHRDFSPKQEALLKGIVEEGKNRHGSSYDALVLFSGGKDSTYMLHRIKEAFPELRVLALTVDTGFMSPIVWGNINRVIGMLGVEHIVYRPDPSFYKKLFRFAILQSGNRGCYDVVDRLGGDALHDIGRNIAVRLNIPILMSGISPAQVKQILGLDGFESPRAVECSTRNQSAGFPLDEIFSEEERKMYWWRGGDIPAGSIPRVLFPFYAWGYDETVIKRKVTSLGLLEPQNTSPIVTNNILIPLMGVIDVKRNGYSSFESEFASLIRSGKADRERWVSIFELLEYAAHSGNFLKKILDEGLGKLDLKRSDIGL